MYGLMVLKVLTIMWVEIEGKKTQKSIIYMLGNYRKPS